MHKAFLMAGCLASSCPQLHSVTCCVQTLSAHLLQGNIMFSNEHPFMTYGNEVAREMAYSAAAILLHVPTRKSNEG
jgi:hypothetical protein